MKFFNTLTEFFNDTEKTVVNDDIIVTAGYSTVNDGGAGTYVVTLVTADESDSGIVISGKTFTKGDTQLELIADSGEVNVEQFGASSAASAAVNKTAIQAAVDSGARRVNFRPVQYLVADDIVINHPVDIVGNGAQLVLETDSTSTQLFRVEYAENTVPTPASIRDMKISEKSDDVGSFNNYLIKLVSTSDFAVSNVDFEYGNYAVYASASNELKNIIVKNCNINGSNNGIYFNSAECFKVSNCKINLLNNSSFSVASKLGIYIFNGCRSATIEDVSVFNAGIAISFRNNNLTENEKVTATERIVVKNFLADGVEEMARIFFNTLPIHFANAMAVNAKNGFGLGRAENLSVTNSSISLLAPDECTLLTEAPIIMYGTAKAKFTHTQFDFPWNFKRMNLNVPVVGRDSELTFVDCTLQKTDIPDVPGVTRPEGFGRFGFLFGNTNKFTETYDACEFRSYISDFTYTENSVEKYNFPAEIFVMKNNGSKVIMKNSRFINETPCTIPYFNIELNDGLNSEETNSDNIVVYNCFFENYNYTDPNNSSVYPIFGRVVNGTVTPSNEDADGAEIHNIFARCNMRSSEPTRNSGTTINEMKEYL